MAYKFSQTQKLNNDFYAIFGTGFKSFYDGLMSIAMKKLCIDIIKFDDWLHERYGDYEDDGKSMDDIVREKYGEKGAKLIEELI